MRYWILILGLLIAAPLYAGQGIIPSAVYYAGEAGPTYIINEGFEGTGAPTNWSETAADPNWDYTAAPLVGLQSLYLPPDAESNGNKRVYATLPSTYTDLYFSAMFQVTDVLNTGADFLAINTNDIYTRQCKVALLSTGQIHVTANGGTVVYSGASKLYAADITYYIMLHYIAGSGSNAECHAYLATSPPANLAGWGDAVSSTNGTTTTAADRIFLHNEDNITSGIIIDSVKVSTSVPTY